MKNKHVKSFEGLNENKNLNISDVISSFIKENLSIDVEEEGMEGYNDKTKHFAIKLILNGEVISETSILL